MGVFSFRAFAPRLCPAQTSHAAEPMNKRYTFTKASAAKAADKNLMEKGYIVPDSHCTGMRSRQLLIACAFGVLAMLFIPTIAWAEPTSQELAQEREGLESELAAAQQHLDQLASEADKAFQELEESRAKLDATTDEVDETKAQIEETGRQLSEKRAALGQHMRDSYKTGTVSLTSLVLGATSFEDLVSRVYYVDRINDARAEEIQEVNRLSEELSAQQRELEEVQARQQEEVEAVEARVTEYEEMVYEAQEYRDGLGEDVQRLLEEEEAARAAEEEAARKAEEEAAHAADEQGESVEPSASEEGQGTESVPSAERTVSAAQVGSLDSSDADRLIYIQWGSRPSVCWPVQGGSSTSKVECGTMTYIHAAILLTGDYSITPDKMVAEMEAKYGNFSSSETYKYVLRYIEEKYGVHHRAIGHISAQEARSILASGHVISSGGGCEGRDGLPFCKAVGAQPRCSHGHVVLFYRYDSGIFWAKDSAPGDGAAMCAYPEGPLTITHHGAAGGRCRHNGETATYSNYADAFFQNSWNVELWID